WRGSRAVCSARLRCRACCRSPERLCFWLPRRFSRRCCPRSARRAWTSSRRCDRSDRNRPVARMRSLEHQHRTVTIPQEVDMPDIKERLSLLWLFALLNYLYADVIALFAIVGSPNLSEAPHLPRWALMGSAVLMEIPIAMILACRFLPFRANR